MTGGHDERGPAREDSDVWAETLKRLEHDPLASPMTPDHPGWIEPGASIIRFVPTGETRTESYGSRFSRALGFTADAHRNQVRKGSGIPYIGHLLGVCALVIEDGGTEDEAIAALLHDAVEDQGGAEMLATIKAEFGPEVAAIVEACSDTMEVPKPAWRERKERYIASLEHDPPAVLRVSLADKLFNARAILRDYQTVGDQLWDRFKAGRDQQLWYYRQLADTFARVRPGPMAAELSATVGEVERLTGPAGS